MSSSLPIPTKPRTEPELVRLDAVPTAVVRHPGVTMEVIREVFDASFAALASSGVAADGPAFAIYRGDPMATFDLEVGFPVADPVPAPVTGQLTVEAGTIPAGPAMGLSALGGYDGLGEAWGRLMTFVLGSGRTPGDRMLEVYVTQPTPEADPAGLRTDIFVTLAS